MKKDIFQKLVQVTTGLAVVVFLTLVANAFTEPSQAPPSGNVSAPLNTSGAAQTKTGTLTFPFFYDYNNTGYYVDPNSTSRINYGIFDNIYSYGWIQSASSMYSPILYDFNDPGYYVDPNSTSRMNYNITNNFLSYGWGYAPIVYDTDNASFYSDPSVTSRFNEIQADRVYGFADIRSPIFYDYNNTGYYVDPNSTSRLNSVVPDSITLGGVTRSTWPSSGISSESDPTVTAHVKDGITWTEISNRPAGLDDGDNPTCNWSGEVVVAWENEPGGQTPSLYATCSGGRVTNLRIP